MIYLLKSTLRMLGVRLSHKMKTLYSSRQLLEIAILPEPLEACPHLQLGILMHSTSSILYVDTKYQREDG
jgi:hypothetical protein